MIIDKCLKDFVEHGKVPVKEILENSVYYPACYDDGEPVKFFNERFAEYGVQSYVYVDYGMKAETLSTLQDGFRHYHVFATWELKESDLVPHKWNPSKYLQYLSQEEVARMKEVFGIHGINPINAFGRWIVYERDEDAEPVVGPEKFSLLYIAGDGAATYAALYLENNIAPRALSIIRPGTGWGGNYSSYFDSDSVFHRIVNSGLLVPEYVFLGNNTMVGYKEFFK